MANQKYILQVKSQLENLMKYFQTINHDLENDDNSQARLEMEYIMTLITELHDRISPH